MDKTTLPERTGTAADWSLELVRQVAAMLPEQWVWPGAPWAAKPGHQRPGPRGRYPTGMHSHPFPEICLAVRGRFFLDVGDHRYAMLPPRVAVLPAGIVHCEGWLESQRSYRTLWLVPSRGRGLASLVEYAPGRGWVAMESRRLESPAAGTLFQRLRKNEPCEKASDLARVRADVLALLAEAHHARCHLASTTAGAGHPKPRPEIEHTIELLDRHFAEPITVGQLAGLTRLTPNHLNRLFQQRTGLSLHRYITRRRMTQAMHLCREGRLSVKEIAAAVGYDDPLYFSRAFRRYHGQPPSRV